MSYDYSELFDEIVATVSMDGTFAERANALVDYCSTSVPHSDWAALRSIDYSADIPRLTSWLSTALSESKQEVKGLWFGLNNPVVEDEATADIYVAAGSDFTSGGIEWTDHLSFLPSGTLNSKVLRSVYQAAYSEKGLGNDAEYPIALAYGGMVARFALETLNLSVVPALQGAAVGFDSGDLMFLGLVADGRFVISVSPG